jgi:putative ABC transport system substrate-binding protein
MRESCTSGSVRGARGNSRPYRDLRRREFIAALGGAAVSPFAARAQRPPTPVIGFVSSSSPVERARFVIAFQQGLRETGYIVGQNVSIEYRWAQDQYDRVTGFAADLARRNVAVIAAEDTLSAVAAKAGRSG